MPPLKDKITRILSNSNWDLMNSRCFTVRLNLAFLRFEHSDPPWGIFQNKTSSLGYFQQIGLIFRDFFVLVDRYTAPSELLAFINLLVIPYTAILGVLGIEKAKKDHYS